MDFADDKISTLQEMAIIQLAVNLCYRNSIKELALCLAKPTYGYFSSNLFFAGDQNKCSGRPYIREQLDVTLEKECQRLTEDLPHVLRDRVRIWINRIALEYQSYRCRLELLFGVSRYFLMTILRIGDWKETGRLDEKKVAVRLLEDKRLTVFQKYHIACVYCLHAHIPELWKKLTEEEISFITEDIEIYRESRNDLYWDMKMLIPHENKKNILVLFWSDQMIRKDKVTERELWTSAVKHAIYFGNRAALEVCWERLNEEARQEIVVDMALRSSLKYKVRLRRENLHLSAIEMLEEISWPDTKLTKDTFNLRSHYAELMLFFLSQMDGEQKLTFFKRTFSEYHIKLKCFLDWPLQDELLLMINRFREIITKDAYRGCMLTLAQKCSDGSTKENPIDEYRNLLWKLWETTPEDLKQYILESLFNRFFSDLSQEGKREIMRCEDRSEFIAALLEQGRSSFLNWFVEECLSKEEISSYKKEFIKSEFGRYWCLCKLRGHRESLVEDVIDWCFEFDSEKSQFKGELMNSKELRRLVYHSLRSERFAEVERMVNFFASSDEMKKEIKAKFALSVCEDLLGNCMRSGTWKNMDTLEKMDNILSWSLASGDEIKDIKKYLFYQVRIESHFAISFLGGNWEGVERFYKWFDLSPEEMEDHKDIIFKDRYLSEITRLFLRDEKVLVTPLLWFLTNKEKVIRFKERLERALVDFSEIKPAPKESLDYLESELLRGLRKQENQNGTSNGGAFVKNKEE